MRGAAHDRPICQPWILALGIWLLGLWPCCENRNFGKPSTDRFSGSKFVVNKCLLFGQEKNPKLAPRFLSAFASLCLVKPWPVLPCTHRPGSLHPS